MSVAAAGAVALAVTQASDDDQSAGPLLAPTTTEPEPATPADAFTAAASALEAAAGFSYDFDGRWELQPDDTSEREVITETGNGQVHLPDDALHTVTSDDGSRRDLMIVADEVWRRSSAFPDQIEQRPWADLGRMGVDGVAAFDPRAVVTWLQQATDHRDGGEDPNGHHVVHAVLPAQAMPPSALDLGGEDEQTLSSEIELTVEAGEPLRVAINATTTHAVVEVALEGIELAAGSEIVRPTGDQVDDTPFLDHEDITAVQGTETLGLGGIPEGWLLVAGYVTPDPSEPDCAEVNLEYFGLGDFDPVSGPESFLYLRVTPEACEGVPTGSDANFTAGGYEGVAEETPEATVGSLHLDGTVVVFASSLSLAELEVVLATIQTVDLTAQPEEIEGIPADPA